MGAGEPPQVEILIRIPDGELSLGHVPLTDVQRTLDALPDQIYSFFHYEPGTVDDHGEGFEQIGQRERHVWDASLAHGLRVIVFYTWQGGHEDDDLHGGPVALD